jgi:hypothetical protein
MTRLIVYLAMLTLLPVSPKTQTDSTDWSSFKCYRMISGEKVSVPFVFERVDTAYVHDPVYKKGVVAFRLHGWANQRISLFWNNELLAYEYTNDKGDAWFNVPLDSKPQIDTVYIDTCKEVCQHEWEWEWITRIDYWDHSAPEQTSWELDSDLPSWLHSSNVAAWKTGNSRCIYCGETRSVKK